MICVTHDCERLTVSVEFGTSGELVLGMLCLDCYRNLVARREQARLAAVATKIRADIMAMPKMTCYGLAGECPNLGALYPGGIFCPDHAPRQNGPETETLLPNLHGTFVLYPDKPAVAKQLSSPEDAEEKNLFPPMLTAVSCPPEKMPGSVRTAVKLAEKHGWAHSVSLAIGPEPDAVHSVMFSACKQDIRLTSRHEGDGTKALGFKTAWYLPATGLPSRIGWRELSAALAGTDPIEDTDKQAMKDAVMTVLDAGGDLVELQTNG
jgi:hypothetical protein